MRRRLDWLLLCPLALFAAGAVQAWRYRHFIYPDGIQYVDLARQMLAGDLSAWANAVWSPGYPAVIALFLAPLVEQPYWWYAAVQAANALAFAIAIWQFHRWLDALLPGGASGPHASSWRVVGAYACAALVLMYLANVRTTTPDMLVAAVILCAARYLLRLQQAPDGSVGVRLGAVLGIGYAVKAVVLPTTLVALGLVAATVRTPRKRRPLLTATGVVVLLAVPLALATSAHAGRPTFGEAGRIVYGWYVLERPFLRSGDRDGYTLASVCDHANTFAWSYPAAVTYAPFYDPAFWRADEPSAFSLTAQMRSLSRIARELADILRGVAVLLPGLVLLVWGGVDRARLAGARMPLILAGVATAIYLPVHIETRFVSAPLLILLTTLLAAARVPSPVLAWAGVAMLWMGTIVMAGPTLGGALRNTALDVRFGESRVVPDTWVGARAAAALGLAPGSRIGVIGATDLELAWAQRARLVVAAHVFDDPLALSEAGVAASERCFRNRGITAIAAPQRFAPEAAVPLGHGYAIWRIGA